MTNISGAAICSSRPVVEKGAKVRRLYLPAGNWYDWWTGEKIAGAKWIERPVDLATMPIYARAGAIVPLDPVRQYTSQPTDKPTTLNVYPGADGEFVIYDDDGASLDYMKDVATWTRVRWNDRARTLTIEPDSRSKAKNVPARRFEVLLAPDGTRQPVDYAGRRIVVKL